MASSSWFNRPSLDLDLNIGPLRFSGAALSPKGLPPAESNHVGEKFFIKKEKAEIQLLESALSQANKEKKKLMEMLASMEADYTALWKKLNDLRASSSEGESPSPSRKRKSVDSELSPDAAPGALNYDNTTSAKGGAAAAAAENCVGGPTESATSSDDSCKLVRSEDCKPKVTKLCVRTDPSDTTLVVKDGYQWRKYGQKVTRDNPCPRAYFRCSFAPSCPVKKKVQRSAEDKTMLVATYDGEHNHGMPPQPGGASISASFPKSSHPHSAAAPTGAAASVAELAPSSTFNPRPDQAPAAEAQRGLVEQMAVALTNDPAFKAALATVISGRMFRISPPRN